jgi:glutathione S-transferase
MEISNNSARIRLWLRIKGLTDGELVETKMISMTDLRTPEYEKINPWKKVPAFITETGQFLFEAVVIMSYLEDRFGQAIAPEPKLVLDTPDDRAFVNLMVRCHDLYVASANCTQPNFSHTQGCMYLDPTPTAFTPARRTMDAKTRAAKLAELHQQLTWLEGQAKLPYLAGDRMSHADLTWWPTIVFCVIIHQRRGYLGEWANADKIDLLVLLLFF